MRTKFLLPLIIFVVFSLGCGGEKMYNQANLNEIVPEQWSNLSEKRIYFGHQSVGYSIIDGIREIMYKIPYLKLNIKETREPVAFSGPIFAHSSVGKNKEPHSKIDDFKRIMESGVGDKVDIAFFKFCYIDIAKDTDVNAMFEYYAKVMNSLEVEFSKVKFIYVTVPLRIAPYSIKAFVKRILGFQLEADIDNIKRNQFNQMLINRFGNEKTIFDLAKYEYTYKNNCASIFFSKGHRYFCLVRQYTEDGGHLNAKGRFVVAGALLEFLATLKDGKTQDNVE